MKFRFHNTILKRVHFCYPLFVLLFLDSISSFASYEYTSKVEAAHKNFLRLKINSGQSQINAAIKEDQSNGLAHLIANYGDFISLMISENKTEYDILKKNEETRLKLISTLSKQSPYYLFIQAEIKLQWAFVKFKFGDDWNALWAIRSAYKLLLENTKLHPDFLPDNKSLGLLQVALGSVPDKYASAMSLAGMKGNVEAGIKNLQSIAQASSPFAFESKLYLHFVENYLLKKQSADETEILKLYKEQPDNLLLTFVYSSLLLKNSHSEEALTQLQNKPTGTYYIQFPYLEHMMGDAYLYKGDYANARTCFQTYLKHNKGKNFIKDSNYKLLLTYLLENNEAKAMPYLPIILKNGQELYDTDKYAQKFASKGILPNQILMKARLYFDGGYYSESLKSLNSFSVTTSTNISDKIEYFYRKGRFYQATGNLSQAMLFYLKTIELSKGSNYYFAPNSALQIGYIYKFQNNIEQAKKYFNLALTYKDYEYKNSIDQKAKAALSEMK